VRLVGNSGSLSNEHSGLTEASAPSRREILKAQRSQGRGTRSSKCGGEVKRIVVIYVGIDTLRPRGVDGILVLKICVVFAVVDVGILVVPKILVILVISIAFEIWDGRGVPLWVNLKPRNRRGICEHVVCALVIVEIDTREMLAELFTGAGLGVGRGWCGSSAVGSHGDSGGNCVV
jgi:hypothetical protein